MSTSAPRRCSNASERSAHTTTIHFRLHCAGLKASSHFCTSLNANVPTSSSLSSSPSSLHFSDLRQYRKTPKTPQMLMWRWLGLGVGVGAIRQVRIAYWLGLELRRLLIILAVVLHFLQYSGRYLLYCRTGIT